MTCAQPMKILVACERSGVVRDAFRSKGHNAVSCDLFPSRRSGPHYQGDVRDILGHNWDMLIAHPVCRFLCNSGVRWLHERPERWRQMEEAAEFFRLFDRAEHIPKRAVENSIMHGYALKRVGRKADQFVQPWWFGDPFTKAAGLWLTGLPPLAAEYARADYSEIKAECHRMAPGPDREEKRSETKPGFARAMACQWG